MNKQRQAVYGMRRQLLEGADQKERVMEMVQGIVEQFIDMRCPDDKHPDTWDLADLRNDILTQFGVKIDLDRARQSQPRRRWCDTIFDQLQRSTRRRKTWWAPTSCARPSASSCCR